MSENMTEDVRQAIQGGLEAQMTKQAVKMAVGAVLNWVPIFKLLPTGELVKIASYKTAEKAVNKRSRTDGLEGAALKDFKHTKAFLLYVGLPPDPDPLYSTWVIKCFVLFKYLPTLTPFILHFFSPRYPI